MSEFFYKRSIEKAMNQSLRSQDLHGVIRVCRAVIAAHEAKKAGGV